MLARVYFFICFFYIFLFTYQVYAQVDSTQQDMLETSIQNILKLPVKGLGDLEIVSASKKAEKVFDAPLAATVLTKEEIKASGATSLIELMKLIPGIMVREISNGNYEVHLRGLEYVAPYSRLTQHTNRTTLIMINGRSVYNHLSGGVFWETLPIDINDIERIEVVRGPSVPLYGANAVSGVIHFITRKKNTSNNIDVIGNVQYGNFDTKILNTSIAYRVNEKLDIGFSSNYQHRHRTDLQYYNRSKSQYIDRSSLNIVGFTPDFIYPDTTLALEKFASNAYLNFHPTAKTELSMRIGTQDSEGHKVYSENGVSNLNFTQSNTNYVDFSAQIGQLKGQYNYWWGITDERSSQAAYKFRVQEANLEYNFDKIANLRITPFVSLRRIEYDEVRDPKRSVLFSSDGVAKGDNYGGGLNIDYLLWKKLRLIGAMRVEHFEISKSTYLAYQAIATYKPNDNLIFRLVVGKSNAGNFIYDTFLSFTRTTPSPIPNAPSIRIEVLGNRNLKLLTQDIIEAGMRWKINKVFSVDVEAFLSSTYNIPINITQAPQRISSQLISQTSRYENTDLSIRQKGMTFTGEVVLPKLNFKTYITFQQSNLINFSPNYVVPEVNRQRNITTLTDTVHTATPPYFGGLILNYYLSKKMQVYINPYFFGQSTYFYLKAIRNTNEPQYFANIPSQILLNIKLSYQIEKRLNLFINLRNLFSNQNFQHFHTDRMRPLYLVGLNFEM
jgi:iron complex outermembrane receptor protein